MWMYGHWPRQQVDHVNGIRHDNRLVNVRPATATQNAQNRRPFDETNYGYKGVKRCARTGRWRASITVNGRLQLIRGTYESAYAAHQAYKRAAKKHFGEFARWERLPSEPRTPAHAAHALWEDAAAKGLIKKTIAPKHIR